MLIVEETPKYGSMLFNKEEGFDLSKNNSFIYTCIVLVQYILLIERIDIG